MLFVISCSEYYFRSYRFYRYHLYSEQLYSTFWKSHGGRICFSQILCDLNLLECCISCVIFEFRNLTTMCGSRKYPHPHGWLFSFYPHSLGISLPEGHLRTLPTSQEFPFFWRGFFFKVTAFLSLYKSENTSFIFTQPLLIICCTHYNNISEDYAVFTPDKIATTF